jgi:hypothetical protein
VLYASAGAARKDEYDEPWAGLDAVLGRGARTAYARFKGPLRSKLELLFLTPLARVRLADGRSFDALATVEQFAAAPGAEVLAAYSDGSPCFVMTRTGKGTGYYMGTMPAEAWARNGLPVVPCGKGGPESNSSQFEPTEFDLTAAGAILRPLTEAGIRPDVRVDKPGIVTGRLASPAGTVVTIVNLAMTQKGPATGVTLSIDGLNAPGKVWSWAFPGGLQHEIKDGCLTVRIPSVGLADVLVIEAGRAAGD